jgi:hypothetical protein
MSTAPQRTRDGVQVQAASHMHGQTPTLQIFKIGVQATRLSYRITTGLRPDSYLQTAVVPRLQVTRHTAGPSGMAHMQVQT